MPSFLSKVFGRKKLDDQDLSPARVSAPSLLEGKFEAVSPTVSESGEKQPEKGKEKNTPPTRYQSPPHLTLNLSDPKTDHEAGHQSLGIVFDADPDAQVVLSAETIGEQRLTPLDTLLLVKACTQVIVARGLESPGLMHPHWYSSDPAVQRRLISLFIHSLAPKSSSTLPLSTSPFSDFESEITSTRSPHDVAAVLRWALRHLKLEGPSFGKDDSWYQSFFDAEKQASYPPNAFSQHLVPQLSGSHLELLTATLDLFSSLAAHAEANSTSGSKISKVVGLWLLEARRAEETDTWSSFYGRWEQAGRKLEHIFLASIRQETLDHGMPKRLTELVNAYPYGTEPTDTLLVRPRFSTRRYTALYIHVDTEIASSRVSSPSQHPLRVLSDAFGAEDELTETNQFTALWAKIREAVKAKDDLSTPLNRVFSDETVRFLSLIADSHQVPPTPSLALVLPNGRIERSSSLTESEPANVTPPTVSQPSSQPAWNGIGIDWAQFSSSGFLETVPIPSNLASTLMDTDLEKTLPRQKSSASRKGGRAGRSLDLPPLSLAIDTQIAESRTRVVELSSIQLDEAFIDFWNDSLLDPIASDWPPFVVGKLKRALSGEVDGGEGAVEWVVIEQTFSRPAPPPVTATTSNTHEANTEMGELPKKARPSSPRPSFRSMGSSKKRFSFWGAAEKSPKKGRASEGGEGDVPETPTKKGKKEKRKSVQVPVGIKEEPAQEKGEENKGNGKEVAAAVAIAGVAAATGAAVVASDKTPAPIAEEAALPTVEESTAPVVEESIVPAVEETTTPGVEEAPVPALDEAPTPVVDEAPAASVPAVQESNSFDTPVVEVPPALPPVATPVIDEPEVSVSPPEVSTPGVVEEPVVGVAEEAIPAVEELAVAPEPTVAEVADEEVVPAIEEEVVEQDAAVVEEPTVTPLAEEKAPTPIVEEESPAPAPVVEERSTPVVEEESPASAVEESISEPTPVVETAISEPEATLVVEEPAVAVEEVTEPEPAPIVENTSTPERAPSPIASTPNVAVTADESSALPEPEAEGEATPPVEEAAPAAEVEVASIVVEEVVPPIVEEAAPPSPVVEESAPSPVVEEEPSPVIEEEAVPVVVEDDVAPAVEDDVALAVEEPAPAVEGIITPVVEETIAPVAEEATPTVVEDAPAVIDQHAPTSVEAVVPADEEVAAPVDEAISPALEELLVEEETTPEVTVEEPAALEHEPVVPTTSPQVVTDVSEPRIEPLREPSPEPEVDLEPTPVVHEATSEVTDEVLPHASEPLAPAGLTKGPEAGLSAEATEVEDPVKVTPTAEVEEEIVEDAVPKSSVEDVEPTLPPGLAEPPTKEGNGISHD